jgi:hypothetical protein
MSAYSNSLTAPDNTYAGNTKGRLINRHPTPGLRII